MAVKEGLLHPGMMRSQHFWTEREWGEVIPGGAPSGPGVPSEELAVGLTSTPLGVPSKSVWGYEVPLCQGKIFLELHRCK